RESKEEQILYRLLTQVVIDPEDALLRKVLEKRAVQRLRRGEVATERLFDDDARVLRRGTARKSFHDGREEARRHRQIVEWPRRAAERLAQAVERRLVGVVAVDVLEKG